MRPFLILLFASTVLAADAPKAQPKNLLTNEGVVLLAEAGLGESFLIDLIESKATRFDTSAEALASLAKQGLTENVLRALVKKQDQPAIPQSAKNEPTLEPTYLRGKVVRQRTFVPDAANGNVAILTMAPPAAKTTPRYLVR